MQDSPATLLKIISCEYVPSSPLPWISPDLFAAETPCLVRMKKRSFPPVSAFGDGQDSFPAFSFHLPKNFRPFNARCPGNPPPCPPLLTFHNPSFRSFREFGIHLLPFLLAMACFTCVALPNGKSDGPVVITHVHVCSTSLCFPHSLCTRDRWNHHGIPTFQDLLNFRALFT